jgi:hypothetical protein
VHLYRLADLILGASRAIPGLQPTRAGNPDWTLRVSRTRASTAGVTWYHRAVLPPDFRLSQLFGRIGDRRIVRFERTATFVIDGAARRITCHPRSTTSMELALHLLISEVLPLVFSIGGRLVLHASAIEVDDGVVGFVGDSGKGKSTLAATLAAQGFPLVTDDCLLVDIDRRGARALPMQAGVRLWPDAALSIGGARAGERANTRNGRKHRFEADQLPLALATGAKPLRRLYLLCPQSRGGASPRGSVAVTGAEAVIALLKAASLFDSDRPEVRRRLFERLTTLVGTTPIHRLTYTRRLSALPALITTVLEENRVR